MRILISGSKGMLGQEFMCQLRGKDVVGWAREDLDITNEQEVMEKVGALKPSVIFNCAAYNNVDKAEDEPQVAKAINGEAVGYLARAAIQCGAVFVHFSTDYVFSGQKSSAKKLTIVNNIAEHGYREDDPPDPISAYGRSKALGEQKVLEIFRGPTSVSERRSDLPISNWYIVRTSKLLGPPGTGVTSKKSFPELMIKIAREKGKVEAVDAEAGSPTYVKDLVEATLNLFSCPSGIYHITNSGSCTWYEYAKAALEYAGLSNVAVVPVGPDHFPRKARRPGHVVLLNTKLPPLRHWQKALQEFLTTQAVVV